MNNVQIDLLARLGHGAGMVKKRRPHGELKPQILTAARTAIATGGLAALSARGLAEQVGVSVGTLYNLFGHLDGIVRAVNLDYLVELHGLLGAAVDGAGETAEDRLLAMGEAYLDFALDQPARWEALFRYRPETPADGEIDAAEDTLFQVLEQAAGHAASAEVLRALWAAVHGVVELAVSQRLARQDPEAPRRYVRLIVVAGLRGVRSMQDEGLL